MSNAYRPAKGISKEPTIRQQRLRAELVREAMDLFHKKGFEQTSLNDVVQVVGISLRTFFRYFRTKEDLAFGWLEEEAQAVADELAKQPKSESAIEAMHSALLENATRRDMDQAVSRAMVRMIFESPALTGRFYLHTAAWSEVCVKILRRAGSSKADQFRLRVQLAAVNGAYSAALREWAFEQKGPFSAHVAAAFTVLGAIGRHEPSRSKRSANLEEA